MNDFSKISYFDLKLEELCGRIPEAFGFEKEIERINRILARQLQHNLCLSAPSGMGKTALIYAWAKKASKNPIFSKKKIVMLNSSTLQKIGQLAQSSLTPYQDSFSSIEDCVLIIDSFGEMIYQSLSSLQSWNTILKPLFFRDDISIILSMQPEELEWLNANKSHFLSHFETLKLEPQEEKIQLGILKQSAQTLANSVQIEEGCFELILKLCSRFPQLGHLPKSAIKLLDEAAAEILGKTAGQKILTKATIEKIAAEKTGIPLERLTQDEKSMLKQLPHVLNKSIIGQTSAITKMVSVIQRAKLGLRSQHKPLGSFLVLGPSGVGKTETAKILAQNLYGSSKHFLRIDMSEFGESHSTSRLLGSPAGYVGYEEGGQLTNHFQNNPYSLLLLDEIEKAHSKIFDIFLQILDDGRITSAGGQTVDLSQSIIMATSNLAVPEILNGYAEGRDIFNETFTKERVIPKLLEHFRMEFLNRFDAILIYKPLSTEELVDIALLEVSKIEERIKEHKIRFNVTREALKEKLRGLADPRFGARPIKRFIEETCENLITEKLLS